MSDWAGILWLAFLLVGNAFFVAAEFAVMSARRSQIEPLAEAGSKRAQTTLRAMESVSLMLACAQLGITVCSLPDRPTRVPGDGQPASQADAA